MSLLGTRRGVGFLFLVLAVLQARAVAQRGVPPAQKQGACWTDIRYPAVEIPSAEGEKCLVFVRSNARSGPGDQKPNLDIAVTWSGRDSKPTPEAMTDLERMSARMHFANGKVVEPQNPFRMMGAAGGAGGRTVNRIGQFPWGANALEEAWFELKIDGRTYWFEVPYGFTRDPLAAVPQGVPAGGPATMAPAMAEMGAEDRVVPWSAIAFDLGVIQKGWRLKAEARNDAEHIWFATLYRETAAWNVNETKTWPRIVDADGGRVEATHVGSRVPDIFRLVHEFSFATYPGSGRSWGMLTVTVDDKPWRVGIPSSLFKHGHAAAGRRHAQAVPLRAQ